MSPILKMCTCPYQYSSVGWASSCKAKGHQFDSQSEHITGLQARSLPGWGHVRGNQ